MLTRMSAQATEKRNSVGPRGPSLDFQQLLALALQTLLRSSSNFHLGGELAVIDIPLPASPRNADELH
eukprot:scaffold8859_cov169-Ochromonas_danica.AAC.7